MKTLTSLILALLLCGCASTSQQQRVESAARIAAYVGTAEYLRAHPESRPGFVSASQTLKVLEVADHIDLAVLLAVVHRLPTQQLKSDRAVLIITAATIFLSDYAGSLPVDEMDNLKPVAKAIREGIDLGLQ